MKRTTLIIGCVLFLISAKVNAQKGKELILGVGGAITSTWIYNQNFYGEPECDYAPKYGYAGSFNLGYNFTEHIALLTELQLSHQGQKYKDDEDGQVWGGNNFQVVERDIKLYYLNIPVFFKYMFGTQSTQFRVMVGPQFGILMDAEQEYLRTEGNSSDLKRRSTYVDDKNGKNFDVTTPNIKNRIEPLDIGIALDVGADISLSDKFYISAGLRFNYGFKDVNTDPYKLENYKGEPYEPSNNIWGGLYLGINYRWDVEGYSQRSF